jgi:formaldehyde-activating enzyme
MKIMETMGRMKIMEWHKLQGSAKLRKIWLRASVMVSKVTVKSGKHTNILMGTVQAAIAHGVLDAVRAGDIPRDKVDDLGIIYSVWLDPAVVDADDLDHKALFDVRREATAKVIRKAMRRGRRSTGCSRTRRR